MDGKQAKRGCSSVSGNVSPLIGVSIAVIYGDCLTERIRLFIRINSRSPTMAGIVGMATVGIVLGGLWVAVYAVENGPTENALAESESTLSSEAEHKDTGPLSANRATLPSEIEQADLGIRRSFGPANALVLADTNTTFDMLVRNRAGIPRGDQDEIIFRSLPSEFQSQKEERAGRQKPTKANDEVPWGELAEFSGLRTRLTLQTDSPKVGGPLLFKLEIKNFGDQPTTYDPQEYAPFRVLRATNLDGEPATFIGMTPQTAGQMESLDAGESRTIWERVDATERYLLYEGEYKFFAEGGKWATQTLRRNSNTLEVKLRLIRLKRTLFRVVDRV